MKSLGAATKDARTFGVKKLDELSLIGKPTIKDLVAAFSDDEAKALKRRLEEDEKELDDPSADPELRPPGINVAECERLARVADAEAFDRETRALKAWIAKREEPPRLGLDVWRAIRREAIGPIPSPGEVLMAVEEEMKSVAPDHIKPNDTREKIPKRNGEIDQH